MIILDTHIWVNWILQGESGLTKPILAAMNSYQAETARIAIDHVGRKSDSAFRQSSEDTAEGAGKKTPAFLPYWLALKARLAITHAITHAPD